MAVKKDSLDRALKDFHFLEPGSPSAVCLLEAVRLQVLHGSDEDHPFRIALDATVQSASRIAARRTPERPLDQSHGKKSLWALFQRLSSAGYGKIRNGRRGHPTRFEFGAQVTCGDLRRVLDDLGIRPGVLDSPVAASRLDAPPAHPAEGLEGKGLEGKGLARDAVVALLKQHAEELHLLGVSALSLFGSVARNEARPDSDVDLMVSFREPVTSAGFFAAKFFLEDLLGRRVDLLTEAAVRERVRQAIEPELVRVA